MESNGKFPFLITSTRPALWSRAPSTGVGWDARDELGHGLKLPFPAWETFLPMSQITMGVLVHPGCPKAPQLTECRFSAIVVDSLWDLCIWAHRNLCSYVTVLTWRHNPDWTLRFRFVGATILLGLYISSRNFQLWILSFQSPERCFPLWLRHYVCFFCTTQIGRIP